MRRPAAGHRAAGALLAVAVLLGGCGGSGPASSLPHAAAGTTDPPAPVTPEVAAPIRLAAVGDSITQADGDVPAGVLGPGSWLAATVADEVTFAGGWARGGATTADMLAAATHVDADVLVVMAGTNDPTAGIPGEQTAADLRALVARTGVPRVVLSAVPPRDAVPAMAVETNRVLAELAAAQGWTFADPMVLVREGDRFAPGMSDDGLHPNPRAAALIGESLRGTVREVARG
ncbi:SGNH/GDSL hydrolase family protein [Geodermatophilus sp. SYSU D00965]